MMSFEEAQAWGRRMKEERERLNKENEEIHNEKLRKMGIDPNTNKYVEPKYDHPSTPDDGFVTVLYIVGMIASLIFKDFWIIWIVLTIAYVKFITRHNND